MMNQQMDTTQLGNLFRDKFSKYELYFLAIIAGCLLLNQFHQPFSGIICTLICMSAGIYYFFLAFATIQEPDITGIDMFIYKITGVCSSISIIGILFTMQHWNGNNLMLFIGFTGLVASLLYYFYLQNKRPETKVYDKNILYRVLFLLIISGIYLYPIIKIKLSV